MDISNYFLKRYSFFAVFAGLLTLASAHTKNPHFVTIDTEYNVVNSIDFGRNYLSGWRELTPIITTYVDNNGIISICSVDSNSQETYIYEYAENMSHIRTIKFHNEFGKFGSFIKDNKGNYYILCAQDVQEGAFNQKNMLLAKYDNDGNRTGSFYLNAQTSDEIWARGYSGIKIPFANGSCRLEISGDWIAAYFSRTMFRSRDGKNHQASYGFIINKDTFERIPNIIMPSAGHSFNQYIFPIENGFIFIDHGDNGPRGFNFARVQYSQGIKNLRSFVLKRGRTYQYTFAQLGGLAETTNGYIFIGTYEKNSSVSHVSHNDSRNIFILTFANDLNTCSRPIWITNYTDKNNENSANSKITKLGSSGHYLIMWECMTQYNYKTTLFKIIDETGQSLTDEIELPNVRLNINDVLRYNTITGNVCWAVNNGIQEIIIYSFNPYNQIVIDNIVMQNGT